MQEAFAMAAAALFADRNLSRAAVFTPPNGTPVQLRVAYTQAADAVLGGGATMGTVAQSDGAEILQSDVPIKPARNSMLVLETGESFKIGSAEPAKRGLVWRVVLTSA